MDCPRSSSRTTSKFAIGQSSSSWVRRWKEVQRDQNACQKAAAKIYQRLRFHKVPPSDCLRTRLGWTSGDGAPLKWNPKLCTCSNCRAVDFLPTPRGDLSLNCHNRLRDRLEERSDGDPVRLGTLVGRGLWETSPPAVRRSSKPYVIVPLPWLVHAREEPERAPVSNTLPVFLPQVVGARIEYQGRE